MKIYTIVAPRDACGMYFQDESNLTYERAVKKANFEGLAREAFEDRVDDDGSALKQYGIGLYYDALYVEAGKEKIIEDELSRTGTDYAVSTVETQLGEYIAFRSFNFCDEIEGASMCRLRKDTNPAEPKVSECFSEEFIDFLSKNFDLSAFTPIAVKC